MYLISLIKLFLKKKFYKFIVGGILNTILSSLFLLLLLEITNVGIATLITDLFHAFLAYFISSRSIFNKKGRSIKYIVFIILAWLLEWYLLESLINLNFSKLISIIILAPFLALISYFLQRFYVFR